MRLLLVPLALAALLLAPTALADQNHVVGPLSVTTANAGTGDCDAQGASSRTASVAVQPDANHRAGVDAGSFCSRNSGPGYDSRFSQFTVIAGYCAYGGCSNAAYTWNSMQITSGSSTFHYCSQSVFLSGPTLYLPCLTPDGSGPPLLPALP